MERERLFYLDFVRALAAVSIVITHYNAVFLYANPQINNCYVIHAFIFNIYIGGFGVSLFLIISGAALMYVYGHACDLKRFYIKRWKTLYPMFWLAYLISFFIIYIYMGNWKTTAVPKSRLILSLLGIDGYLADIMPTFYLVGEWFLGFIIIFYLVFPLLRWCINKHPVLLAVIVLGIYIALEMNYPFTFVSSKNLFVRLPELLFGMYFIKYIKRVRWPAAAAGLAVLILNQLCKPNFPVDVQTTYVGIAAFLVLVFVSQMVKNELFKGICAWISKYSYAIFLVHHIVIYYVMMTFDLYSITHIESYLLFLGFCVVVAVLSKLLYDLDFQINKGIKKLMSANEN
ncbi:MAG: acyltransferase [Lachnospiraceae bacterium]|nr:acyltransferase [Lachnospiraceae bacterium]